MIYLALSAALAFLVTLIGTPYARKYLLDSGIYGVDQQKESRPRIPTSGGVVVFFGLLAATTSYMGFEVFLGAYDMNITLLLAALSSINIITLIGLIDDIHIKTPEDVENTKETGKIGSIVEKTWERLTGAFGDVSRNDTVERSGLGQLPKMLFVLPAALPLIAVGAGSWTMHFPLIGTVDWGILYPLLLLPVGLLFVSNVVNMLAGTNGLSAGMSLVAAFALGLYASMNGQAVAALIAFGLAGSLLGFLYYNLYPASILPGDSLTYLIGASLFSAIVIGNMEKFAVFIFIPWIAEFFLKLRSGFRAHSWGELQEDGSLQPVHDRNYSLTHPLMRRGLNEREITAALIGVETLICAAGLILFNTVI